MKTLEILLVVGLVVIVGLIILNWNKIFGTTVAPVNTARVVAPQPIVYTTPVNPIVYGTRPVYSGPVITPVGSVRVG